MRYIKIQFLQHRQHPFDSFGVLDSPVLEILSYRDMLLNLLLKSLISCRSLIYLSFSTPSKFRFCICLISPLAQLSRKAIYSLLEPPQFSR